MIAPQCRSCAAERGGDEVERDLIESHGSIERLLNEAIDSIQGGEYDAARKTMEELANDLHSGVVDSDSAVNKQRYAETLENIEHCLEGLGSANLKDAIDCAERAVDSWSRKAELPRYQ